MATFGETTGQAIDAEIQRRVEVITNAYTGQEQTYKNTILDLQRQLAEANAKIEDLRNPDPVQQMLVGAGGGNVDRRNSPIAVDRRYYGSTDAEVAKALRDIKANGLAGIVTWVSFKVPVSWTSASTGGADAWFAKVCKALKEGVDQIDEVTLVILSVHHEPEGDEPDETKWRAMQDRLSRQVPGGITGPLKYTLTTTGWNQEFNKSAVAGKVDWDSLYPKGAPIWGIAYDAPYQTYGQEYDKTGAKTSFNNAWTDPKVYINALADRAAAISKSEGRTGDAALKALVGEWGYGDEAFAKDKTWAAQVLAQAKARGLFAIAYFDTKLNSSHTWFLGAAGSAKRVYVEGLFKTLNG